MDVTSRLQSFIAQYTGVITGDTPPNIGQCVGLSEKWLDVFNLPHIWGNAKDLLTNATDPSYTVIKNSPTNSPAPGDIFVFDDSFGGGFGHTGIVTSADVNTVTLFEQNDTLGNAPQLKTYTYNGALGWIHPNIFTPTTNQTMTDQQVTDQLNAQIAATSQCQNQLKAATDQITSIQNQLTTETETVQSLQGELKDAKSEIATLQAQLDGEQKEIISLNAQIEVQASSNKDYGTQALELTHANTDLTNYLYSTADTLGVDRKNKKLADVQESILIKLDEVDSLLKAANLAEGLLHNMASSLQLNDPNASDQQIANNIIQYVKGLQGKLQNIIPGSQQTTKPTSQQTGFFSKLVGWFWQKGV